MQELQGFIYGYANGYNTRTCTGCTLSSKEVSEYNGMGAAVDKEKPCLEFNFDNRQNNMVAVLHAKQQGTGNAQANCRQVAVLQRLSVEDFRSREILPFFDIDFAPQEDVAAIVAGTKAFNKVGLGIPKESCDRVIGTNLLVQIVCDAIYAEYTMSRNQITLVVPDNADPITVLRNVAKQVLDSIPYGLSNRFSFSFNSTDCRIRVISRQNDQESAGMRYELEDELEEIHTSLQPTLVRLIRECAEDRNTREFVYQSFEKQYNGNFPKTADYLTFSDAYAMIDSQTADWEYFEDVNNVLSSIGKQFSPELKGRIAAVIPDSVVLSEILTSNSSAFISCDSLGKLENTLKTYGTVLDQLAEAGIKPNADFANRILAAIELPKGYRDLNDEKRFLESDGTMMDRFLDKTVIAERCKVIDSAMNTVVEDFYDSFRSELDTAINNLSVREFDSACKRAETQPFYDKKRCSYVIAYMLRNPCDYKEKCEEFYSCALRHASKPDLASIGKYVADVQQFNRTKEGMTDFRNYLRWAIFSSYDDQTAEEFLNTVFDNAKRNNYAESDICDLLDALEQVGGKYAFDRSSEELQIVKTILNHKDVRILLNKNKNLATVYRELLFCAFNNVDSIRALCSDGTSSCINVGEAVDSLQRVLNYTLCSSDFKLSDKEKCAVFAQHCSLTQNEKELIGTRSHNTENRKDLGAKCENQKKNKRSSGRKNGKIPDRDGCKDDEYGDVYDEYNDNSKNNSRRGNHNKKKTKVRRTNKQRSNNDLIMTILIVAAALLIIGGAIFLIFALTKDKEDIPSGDEIPSTEVPSVSPTEDIASTIEPTSTIPTTYEPMRTPGPTENIRPEPKDGSDQNTYFDQNSGTDPGDSADQANGNGEPTDDSGNT